MQLGCLVVPAHTGRQHAYRPGANTALLVGWQLHIYMGLELVQPAGPCLGKPSKTASLIHPNPGLALSPVCQRTLYWHSAREYYIGIVSDPAEPSTRPQDTTGMRGTGEPGSHASVGAACPVAFAAVPRQQPIQYTGDSTPLDTRTHTTRTTHLLVSYRGCSQLAWRKLPPLATTPNTPEHPNDTDRMMHVCCACGAQQSDRQYPCS